MIVRCSFLDAAVHYCLCLQHALAFNHSLHEKHDASTPSTAHVVKHCGQREAPHGI